MKLCLLVMVGTMLGTWWVTLAQGGRLAHAEAAKARPGSSSSARPAPSSSGSHGAPRAGARRSGVAGAPKMTHDEAAASLKGAILQVETASHELDLLHEESKRLTAQLHAANLQIQRGRQRLFEGQRSQKLGRELRRRGSTEAGDAKIAAGQKMIDEAAREIEQGISVVRSTQTELNALSLRVARYREQVEDGRRKAKAAEVNM